MSGEENSIANWWATGDMPVRDVHRLAFLIDGRMAMLEMCVAFLCARLYWLLSISVLKNEWRTTFFDWSRLQLSEGLCVHF